MPRTASCEGAGVMGWVAARVKSVPLTLDPATVRAHTPSASGSKTANSTVW